MKCYGLDSIGWQPPLLKEKKTRKENYISPKKNKNWLNGLAEEKKFLELYIHKI